MGLLECGAEMIPPALAPALHSLEVTWLVAGPCHILQRVCALSRDLVPSHLAVSTSFSWLKYIETSPDSRQKSLHLVTGHLVLLEF